MALRPMAETDLDTVLAWRNLPQVRANSRSDAVIAREEHQRWFARIQSDPACAAYLVLQDGRDIGVCHYQGLHTPITALSYYVGVDRLWPGTGVLLQWLALEQAFQRLAVECLVAEVLEHNQAPQRLHHLFAFEHTGASPNPVQRAGQAISVQCFRLPREHWLAQRETVLNSLPAPTRAATDRCQLWPQQELNDDNQPA